MLKQIHMKYVKIYTQKTSTVNKPNQEKLQNNFLKKFLDKKKKKKK